MKVKVAIHRLPSMIGDILLARTGTGICGLDFGEREHEAAMDDLARRIPGAEFSEDASAHSDSVRELEEYFAGTRQRFTVPLDLRGSDWELRVWKELLRIPYGETASYGDIAARLGQPGAARAVGLANSRNPVGIIVPCHRVIAADGSLGGYSAGLPRKVKLLDLERQHASKPSPQLDLPLAAR